MIDRRHALAGIAAASGAAALSHSAQASDGKQAASSPLTLDAPMIGPRMNRAQAIKVMDQLGLDALILGSGINVYHATGYWPLTDRMGHAPSTLAIVTRSDEQPLSVVLSSFTYYYQLADVHRTQDYPAYTYTGPTGQIDDNGEPVAAPVMVFRDRKEVPLDAV